MSFELVEDNRRFAHQKIASANLCDFPQRTSARNFTSAMRLILSAIVASTLVAHAQGPTARFSRPTTEVGQPLDYELRYEHAPGEEVVFPDSLASFAPFEYISRTWQPTRTQNGRSLDRTVYHLRTFALTPTQALRLPVLVLRGSDT